MSEEINQQSKEEILSELRDCLGYAEKWDLTYAIRLLKKYIKDIEELKNVQN